MRERILCYAWKWERERDRQPKRGIAVNFMFIQTSAACQNVRKTTLLSHFEAEYFFFIELNCFGVFLWKCIGCVFFNPANILKIKKELLKGIRALLKKLLLILYSSTVFTLTILLPGIPNTNHTLINSKIFTVIGIMSSPGLIQQAFQSRPEISSTCKIIM